MNVSGIGRSFRNVALAAGIIASPATARKACADIVSGDSRTYGLDIYYDIFRGKTLKQLNTHINKGKPWFTNGNSRVSSQLGKLVNAGLDIRSDSTKGGFNLFPFYTFETNLVSNLTNELGVKIGETTNVLRRVIIDLNAKIYDPAKATESRFLEIKAKTLK